MLTELTPVQIEHLADILVAVVDQGASVGFLAPLDRETARRYWALVPGSGAVLLVAERDGLIVGTAQLHPASSPNGSHRAEVAKVLVHPSDQRRGIARRLMRALEDEAVRRGRTLLVLDTRAGDGSNALYRGLGYVEAGRIPRYARSSTGRLDDTVLYYKAVRSGVPDT